MSDEKTDSQTSGKVYKTKFKLEPYNVLKIKIPVHYPGIERYKSKMELLLKNFSRYLFWISLKLRLWILNRNVYKVLGMLPVPKARYPNGWLAKI